MNEGDLVRYVGTLPNGPARVVEVGDGRAIVDLEGTGRVECAVTDLKPWYAEGGFIGVMDTPIRLRPEETVVWPIGSATEQAVAGAQYIKQNYGGTDPGGSSG